MSKIDFTKPLEFDRDGYEVITIFPVKYRNLYFTHGVHYRDQQGDEHLGDVTQAGFVNGDPALQLRNKQPKVVAEVFVNVYDSGFAGCTRTSMSDANNNVLNDTWGEKRTGILHTAIYDDGQVQQELIQL